MNDETEEWILQPVEAGMCRYESLLDGTLGLHDIARMNEYIAVQNENKARVMDAQRDADGR
jgi:hypothetical protein